MNAATLQRCRRRLDNRLPLLGPWLRARAVRQLMDAGTVAAIRMLSEAAASRREDPAYQEALDALFYLAKAGNLDAREALCRLVIAGGDRRLLRAVANADYLPRQEGQRAVFFFLTEQWERYESLDFEHDLLRAAYA